MSYKITNFNINGTEADFITSVTGNLTINNSNQADNEDLTAVNNKLKFADKTYNSSSFSGLGKIYLRKNISSNKNILTQNLI